MGNGLEATNDLINTIQNSPMNNDAIRIVKYDENVDQANKFSNIIGK
jgi:hypothetical protein